MRWNQVVKIFVRRQQEGIGGNGSRSNPQIVLPIFRAPSGWERA
jgi:hypothetical protein